MINTTVVRDWTYTDNGQTIYDNGTLIQNLCSRKVSTWAVTAASYFFFFLNHPPRPPIQDQLEKAK